VYGPVAGDEGWVARISNPSLSATTLVVSGDATIWHQVTLGMIGTVAAVGGDWIASVRSDDWQRLDLFRSSNGLDWEMVLDPNTLTPPDGPKSNQGLDGFHGVAVSGTGEVAVLSLWWNHCCAMPDGGLGIWWSTDGGAAWTSAGLGDDARAVDTASNREVTVIAGYTHRGGVATFWVSAP
jgi:hypothetical protein